MKGDRISLKTREEVYSHLSEEADPKIRLKLAFLACFSRLDMDLDLLCEAFGIAVPTGYWWIRNWNSQGYEGLLESLSRPGRPPRLDDTDLSYLASLLRIKPAWTVLEVVELIQSTFNIHLSAAQVAKILRKRLKMYFGKPFIHDHRRPEDAAEGLRERLNSVFKTLKDKHIPSSAVALGFIDETRPQNRANTVRVWSFEPSPVVVRNTDRFQANTIGFYALKGQNVQGFLTDSSAESIEAFLENVKAKNTSYQAIVIVWDNFSSHHAALIQAAAERLGIYLVFLPPYSPDLNPEEYLWKSLKRKVCEAFVKDLEAMKAVIQQGWRDLCENLGFARYWIEDFLGPASCYSELSS